VHSLIQFLNAKNVHLAESHRQVVKLYGGIALKTGKGIWGSVFQYISNTMQHYTVYYIWHCVYWTGIVLALYVLV